MRLRAILATLAFAVLATAALAQSLTFPELTGRVVDEAGILDAATRQQLEKLSADLEAKTTDQLVVVTLKSLQGASIEDYGYQLGRKWQIGQKDRNNGVVLIVAPNDRRVRIEVGYGLEPTLTDAISSVIIQGSILPRFRAGDFAGGVRRGAEDIAQVLSGDAAEIQERAAQRQAAARGLTTGELLILAFWIFVAFMIISNVVASMRGRRGGIAPGQVRRTRDWAGPVVIGGGRSSGGGWSGGGSWSGGGGFSGGGGSFGGGGSSGSW
ncbi:MAG: YgcG family protein [Pseudorhodoplanes sp.]|uniref:TPM domain-containing protein n=1 Tax=Pseudorhodoplanes sp. TaxID=1934341 RepID=UPI003D0D42C0